MTHKYDTCKNFSSHELFLISDALYEKKAQIEKHIDELDKIKKDMNMPNAEIRYGTEKKAVEEMLNSNIKTNKDTIKKLDKILDEIRNCV